MSSKMFRLISFVAAEAAVRHAAATLVLVLATMALTSMPVFGQVSGAIFTTDEGCTGVNLNIYRNKQHVWLDGGPRKAGATGLPPGDYYVQVTDPSGSCVLGTSIDGPVHDKPVVVNEAGEFEECYQLCAILRIPDSPCIGKGNRNCGYADTPNRGGVYKVWVSQNPDFPHSESKTDNFKVKGKVPTEIRVIKFYDANMNGRQDEGEVGIPEWHIELIRVRDGAVVGCDLTDGGGEVEFLITDRIGTEYDVNEVPPAPGWFPDGDYTYTTPISVRVIADQQVHDVNFGNVCFLRGFADFDTKGYWHNKNGIDELTAEPNCFEEVLAYVHSWPPYQCRPDYFSKGDVPFDGRFNEPWPDCNVSDQNVPAGKGVLEKEFIAPEATVEAEISNFLIDAVGDGGIREQLTQQLLAFIFNVSYRIDDCGVGADTMILLPDGTPVSISELISCAVSPWSGVPDPDCTLNLNLNEMATLLDWFNNNDSVMFLIIPAEPCPFEPVPCL